MMMCRGWGLGWYWVRLGSGDESGSGGNGKPNCKH